MNSPDELDTGLLLYDEKPESYRLVWRWSGLAGIPGFPYTALRPYLALRLVIFGLFCLIFFLLGLPITVWFLIPAMAGLVLSIYGVKLFFESYWSFKVYEKGLRPQWKHLPFFRFTDVDFVRIVHDTFELVTKKGRTYILYFLRRPGLAMGPESRARLRQIIIEQMKKTHPDANPHWLVRDISRVEWSDEAFKEYVRAFGPSGREVNSTRQKDLKSAISEEVLKEGRDRVELADVQRFPR